MKSILITGINGFLGSNLAKALSKDSNIIGLEYSHENTFRINKLKIRMYSSQDQSLDDIFNENMIDIIIHTATVYRNLDNSLQNMIETNVLLPARLLEISQNHGVGTFINTDSFFNNSQFNYTYLKEYSLSKRQCLEWLMSIKKETKIINMKLFHMYGPGDLPIKFVPQIISDLKNNKPEIELTPGGQKRDFIYIDDVVSAYLAVINNIDKINNSYIEFQVGSGEAVTLKEFVEMASLVTHSRSKLLFGALKYREGEIMYSEADIHKLRELNWYPVISLKQGIEKAGK